MEENKLEISQEQVQKSVEALLQTVKEKSSKSNSLFEEADKIHLQFSLKKIPLYKQQIIKLKLPHGLDTNREVCLFVKDLDKADREYEKTVRHFKKLLKTEGIEYVSQVIPLKALKLEYKPYEAKRKLANSFDIFLADATIIRLLPSFLGKAFYGRKRLPIQVRMDSRDLKGEFQAALSNSRCVYSGRGASGLATVGTSDMSVSQLVENVIASAHQITGAMPGGADNIRALYIKTETSLGVPVYMCLGSANEVKLPAEPESQGLGVEMGDVTTVQEGMVKVYPSGIVKIIGEDGKVTDTLIRKIKKRPSKEVKRAGKRSKDGKKAAGKNRGQQKDGRKGKKSRLQKDAKNAAKGKAEKAVENAAKSRPEKSVVKTAKAKGAGKTVKMAGKPKQPVKAVKRAGKRK